MSLPPRLYHYQPFNPQRLSPIIERRTIYFSNPRDFNDPWDCRPCFDVSGLKEPSTRERHIAFYIEADRKHRPKPEAEHTRIEHALRSTPGMLEKLMAKMNGGLEEDIFARYRVYCLSSKPDCTLMWSHYAANHTGICLEYDTDERTTIATALGVKYCDQYPTLELPDKRLEGLLALTAKSAVWSYEAEYRLIAQERAAAAPGSVTLMTDNNLLTLPEGALRAIIVGCSMSDTNRTTLQGMIKRSSSKIELREATRVPNRYDLTIS